MKTFTKLLAAAAFWMALADAQAQSIRVTDKDGRGIPYATVLNTKGNLIGTTNLAGILDKAKVTGEVLVTHAAYKPQQVTVSSLEDGNIIMEEINYSLSEAKGQSSSYYVETYYRAYFFSGGNLIYYSAGIMPVECNLKNGKVKTGSHKDCRGVITRGSLEKMFVSMNATKYFNNHFSRYSFVPPMFLQDKKMLEERSIEMNEDEKGGKRFCTPKGIVAYTAQTDGQTCYSTDMVKLFGNKAIITGQGTMTQMVQTTPEHRNVNKLYTAVSDYSKDGIVTGSEVKIFSNHYNWKTGFSFVEWFDFVVETYITERSYIDSKDFKTRQKQLKAKFSDSMSLAELEAYAAKHHIPALAPTLRRAIERLKKE